MIFNAVLILMGCHPESISSLLTAFLPTKPEV